MDITLLLLILIVVLVGYIAFRTTSWGSKRWANVVGTPPEVQVHSQAVLDEESVDKIATLVKVNNGSVRFDFARDPNNPEAQLVVQLNNESKYEVKVEKIYWHVMMKSKKSPVVEGFFSGNILLQPQSALDQLSLHEAVNMVDARYVSRAKQGLTSDCYVEGILYGEVGHRNFERNFLLVNVPCLIQEESGPLNNPLIEPTHIDALTGLLNRLFLTENLQRIIDSATTHEPVSFIMLDVDNFKTINDEYGHLIGDDVLKVVCTKVRETVENKGFSMRYGGDEICVVLMKCDIDDARLIAEKMRSAVADYDFKGPSGVISITVSIGIATLRQPSEYKILVQQADDMLRRSKRRGKNRVSEIWVKTDDSQ